MAARPVSAGHGTFFSKTLSFITLQFPAATRINLPYRCLDVHMDKKDERAGKPVTGSI